MTKVPGPKTLSLKFSTIFLILVCGAINAGTGVGVIVGTGEGAIKKTVWNGMSVGEKDPKSGCGVGVGVISFSGTGVAVGAGGRVGIGVTPPATGVGDGLSDEVGITPVGVTTAGVGEFLRIG